MDLLLKYPAVIVTATTTTVDLQIGSSDFSLFANVVFPFNKLSFLVGTAKTCTCEAEWQSVNTMEKHFVSVNSIAYTEEVTSMRQ